MPAPVPIASRTLVFDDGEVRSVEVVIFSPVPSGDDFECCFEIRWPENVQKGHSFGVDSLQALENALKKIGIDLNSSEAATAEQLYWIEPGRGFGFPVPQSMRHLLHGDDKETF
jgi:hypothetical protein